MYEKLEEIEKRYDELQRKSSEPDVVTVSTCWTSVKVAITDLAASIVTVGSVATRPADRVQVRLSRIEL